MESIFSAHFRNVPRGSRPCLHVGDVRDEDRVVLRGDLQLVVRVGEELQELIHRGPGARCETERTVDASDAMVTCLQSRAKSETL